MDYETWLRNKISDADKAAYDSNGFMVFGDNWNCKAYIHNELNYVKSGIKAAIRLLRFFMFGAR